MYIYLGLGSYCAKSRKLAHVPPSPRAASVLTWRNCRLPSPPQIISSMSLSVCESVHACRLGIEQKMAQAQQIQSNFLQNHEST